MKHFSISIKRWNNFRKAMLELGNGRLDQQLKIRDINDVFEGVEALFNMVIEELRRRLLHLSFVKPADFQRYTSHYVLITNKNFRIVSACEVFLAHYQLELEPLKERSFLDLTDEDTAAMLKETCGKTTDLIPDELYHIELFDDRFLCSVSRLSGTKQLVINLYQLHLQKEYFKATYEMAGTETARLFENKRYYEIIEKIKDDIDQLPLTVKANTDEIIEKYSINSNIVKKLFKEQYGCGTYEYQISLRMQKAYYLISNTEKSFKEIAAETSYSQYSDFVKYFKKYYGILPKELRNKSKQQ